MRVVNDFPGDRFQRLLHVVGDINDFLIRMKEGGS